MKLALRLTCDRPTAASVVASYQEMDDPIIVVLVVLPFSFFVCVCHVLWGFDLFGNMLMEFMTTLMNLCVETHIPSVVPQCFCYLA